MKHHNRLWLVSLAALLLPASLPAVSWADQPVAPAASAAPVHASVHATSHERLLPLQGGRNFRDLGGYRTTDGRQVKWGLLFRSGSMHGLTAADYAALEARHIRVVCDFRSTAERTGEPANWPAEHAPAILAPTILADDYELARSGVMPVGDMRAWNADQARAAVAATYPHILTYFTPQYRRMFAELLAGHAPLAFNCTAGKDRTGVGAALVLTALGVPRETVVEDYLLTNRYLDQSRLLAAGSTGTAKLGISLPQPVIVALMSADRSYIEAALDAMAAHRGGVPGFLRDEMGLDRHALRQLRARYLEAARN